MSKVDAIMAQRAALVREVKLVQGAMEAQEKRMREALDGMQVRRRGRACRGYALGLHG